MLQQFHSVYSYSFLALLTNILSDKAIQFHEQIVSSGAVLVAIIDF